MVERILLGCCFLHTVSHHSVWGYYCASEKCDFDEYCCGYQQCCSSYDVWQMWYFWLGLVIFLIFLAACFSFWRYRCQQALVIQSCQNPYNRFEQAQPGGPPPSQLSPNTEEERIPAPDPDGSGHHHRHGLVNEGPGLYKDGPDRTDGSPPGEEYSYYPSPRKMYVTT